MTDHFLTLDQPRRPWLEPEPLKQRFLELSTRFHPDKAAGPAEKSEFERRFSAVNQAYETLRQTRKRLLHLLELETSGSNEPAREIPPEALELFPEIAEATSRLDRLLREKAGTTSPMSRIAFMEKALELTELVHGHQARIRQRIDQVELEVRKLDALWPEQRAVPALRRAAAALGFLERWDSQLQERLVALTF